MTRPALACILALLAAAPATALPLQPAPTPARAAPTASAVEIRAAQTYLNALGYDAGVVDGVVGPKFRQALRGFQRRIDAPTTGTLDAAQLDLLRRAADARTGAAAPAPQAAPRQSSNGVVTLRVSPDAGAPAPQPMADAPTRTASAPLAPPPAPSAAPQPAAPAPPAPAPTSPVFAAPETPEARPAFGAAQPQPQPLPPAAGSGLIAAAPGFAEQTVGGLPATLIGQTWRIVDDNQAEMEVTFAADNRVEGPAFADGLRWTRDGDVVWLVFETPLGGRAARMGRLLGPTTMQGQGESARPGEDSQSVRRWAWRATRVR